MTSKSALDAIDPHTYGLKAADARTSFTDQLFTSTDCQDLIASLQFINDRIAHPDDQDRARGELIKFAYTGDRDEAIKAIKGYEYLAAHLHLGQHMHALRMRGENPPPPPPVIDEIPAYPVRNESYQPAVTSIIEILCETIQASNAPSAAIPAATYSI